MLNARKVHTCTREHCGPTCPINRASSNINNRYITSENQIMQHKKHIIHYDTTNFAYNKDQVSNKLLK